MIDHSRRKSGKAFFMLYYQSLLNGTENWSSMRNKIRLKFLSLFFTSSPSIEILSRFGLL